MKEIAETMGMSEIDMSKSHEPSLPKMLDRTEHQLDIVRSNINDLIDSGLTSLEELKDVARQSQNIKAYEAIAKLIDSTVAANEKLVDVELKRKQLLSDVKKEEPQQQTNIQNNMFFGSTAELQQYLTKNKNNDH